MMSMGIKPIKNQRKAKYLADIKEDYNNESNIIQSCQTYLKQCESGNKHFMTPDIDGIIDMLNADKDTK